MKKVLTYSNPYPTEVGCCDPIGPMQSVHGNRLDASTTIPSLRLMNLKLSKFSRDHLAL